jgi:YD repeat-containing protein
MENGRKILKLYKLKQRLKNKFDQNENNFQRGDEYWMEYDANGNLIHHKNTEGIEWNITIK